MNLAELQGELKTFRDQEMPVRIPWPSPPEQMERTTTPMDPAFLKVQESDGRQTLVAGNTVNSWSSGRNPEGPTPGWSSHPAHRQYSRPWNRTASPPYRRSSYTWTSGITQNEHRRPGTPS